MSSVTLYGTQWCPFCLRAEQLLQRKGIADVRKIDVGSDPALRQDMTSRSGQRTVPQIFIGDTHIGGVDDLAALDRAGKLDELLR